MENEYKVDQSIDEYNLIAELKKQSMLYMKWAKRCALAVKEKARAEENLKVVRAECKKELDEKRAEIDADIRTNLEKYGFKSKPTETAISGCIIRRPEYKEVDQKGIEKVKEAFEDLLIKIEAEETLSGAKVAMSHKKTSIEYISQLWLGGYYSEPKIPKEMKDKIEDEDRSQHDNKLTEQLKGRKS